MTTRKVDKKRPVWRDTHILRFQRRCGPEPVCTPLDIPKHPPRMPASENEELTGLLQSLLLSNHLRFLGTGWQHEPSQLQRKLKRRPIPKIRTNQAHNGTTVYASMTAQGQLDSFSQLALAMHGNFFAALPESLHLLISRVSPPITLQNKSNIQLTKEVLLLGSFSGLVLHRLR